MKVAFLASEAIPYAKTGGLADVAGALPKFLARLGVDVRVFMPFYREVKAKNLPLRTVINHAAIDLAGERRDYSVLEHKADGFSVYMIVRDEYYDRDG
ncbi:MAG: glycogen/starch synthase, partial [Candidatus Aminicenantales bacterium]